MGFFTAAIAFFSHGGVGERERLPDCSSDDEGEPKSTILVIDDDPIVLLTVKTLLVKRGFNVLTSSSSPKGLDMIRYAGDIRIVVLDFSMPKLNGDETLKFIKQLSPNAKVIGLTAMKFDSLPREYIDGIDGLLSKPVVAAILFDAIDKVLGDEQTVSAAIES